MTPEEQSIVDEFVAQFEAHEPPLSPRLQVYQDAFMADCGQILSALRNEKQAPRGVPGLDPRLAVPILQSLYDHMWAAARKGASMLDAIAQSSSRTVNLPEQMEALRKDLRRLLAPARTSLDPKLLERDWSMQQSGSAHRLEMMLEDKLDPESIKQVKDTLDALQQTALFVHSRAESGNMMTPMWYHGPHHNKHMQLVAQMVTMHTKLGRFRAAKDRQLHEWASLRRFYRNFRPGFGTCNTSREFGTHSRESYINREKRPYRRRVPLPKRERSEE